MYTISTLLARFNEVLFGCGGVSRETFATVVTHFRGGAGLNTRKNPGQHFAFLPCARTFSLWVAVGQPISNPAGSGIR